MITSKCTVALSTTAFFGLSLILLVSGCSSIAIRTAVEIEAPPNEVYEVLADLERYPEWNPYHRKIEGDFDEGAAMKIYVTRPDGKEVKVPPHMMRIVKNKEMTWGGGIKGIFYGVHSFTITPQSNGNTLLQQDEDFSGFAVRFADLPPDVIAAGYHQMNMALKKRVETKEHGYYE